MIDFYIVDDDISIRRVLYNIITTRNLGRIAGETGNGNLAFKEILKINPDIVLMDLLLPGNDGIETIKKLKAAGSTSHFIMISQVDAQNMVSMAYQSGIEFYIHKPLNVTEVLSVIGRVNQLIMMEKSLSIIQQTVQGMKPQGTINAFQAQQANSLSIDTIISDLGITGEAGSNDIKRMIEFIRQKKKSSPDKYYNYKLGDMYKLLSNHFEKGRDHYHSSSEVKAIEQRIRRTVAKALQNLATLGIENHHDPKFTRYSTSLFDFKEVKQEMDFLRNNSNYHGKISVKKFLEGLMLHIDR